MPNAIVVFVSLIGIIAFSLFAKNYWEDGLPFMSVIFGLLSLFMLFYGASSYTIEENIITENVEIMQTIKDRPDIYKTSFITEDNKELYFTEDTFSPYFAELKGEDVELTYKQKIYLLDSLLGIENNRVFFVSIKEN